MVDPVKKKRVLTKVKPTADVYDDSQFNIVAKFIIPVEECEDYCKNVVHRRFIPRYCKNIMVKIAIC